MHRHKPSPVGLDDGSGEDTKDPTVGRSPGFNAVRKAEAWGQGECFSPFKWRPTPSRKPGFYPATMVA